jgi:type I restriction enzyme R subunit
MLEQAVKNYQNNLITSAQIIDELINLAKDIKEADRKGEELGLRLQGICLLYSVGSE